MTAGWVAGTVRAKAMARRVLGADAARQVAACQSLEEAQRLLRSTPLRGVAEPGLSLAAAQHAVAESVLWDLRVLAGWLPREGVSLLRLLAGWFEIANVDELLQVLDGQPSGAVFELGALATAWPRLRAVRSAAELRRELTGSAWGDPGGDTGWDIRAGMRARWATRVAASGGRAGAWASSAAALAVLAVRGRQPRGRPAPPQPLLAAVSAAEPWAAEAHWWRQVEREGRVLLRSSEADSGPVIGAVAVMATDAWRVRAALASAARGGAGRGGLALEAYDAVA
ncbi:MAG TPA: hypothetical protein VMB74_05045 [Streptosporangiaceae bacterium]|nr:hypothetical protein [Streptosporangiaceae bacterium]